MRYNIYPQQIPLFKPVENRGVFERGGTKKRFSHIYHNIICLENLLISWQEFLRGKRKRKDVDQFSIHLIDNIFSLHQELSNKTYNHGQYKAFKINDPKPRDIHKAKVKDRLIHHAIYRILYPYFDQRFIFDSYSCRMNKGTHRAINRFRTYGQKVSSNNSQTAWILKCDIRKFFANIDHKILKDILGCYIDDVDTLWLFEKVIDSFHTNKEMDIGLPLGNLTSQLFINIYMNEFDQYLKQVLKVKYYIRYADDFVILHKNKQYLINLLPYISKFLGTRLKLLLHPDKVFIKPLNLGIDFLGWVHFPHHRVLRTSTKRRMFNKLKNNHSSATITSYQGLLKHGNTYKILCKLHELYSNEKA